MLIVNLDQATRVKTPHGSEIRPLIDRTTAPVTQCSLAQETLLPGQAVGRHHHDVIEEIYFITSSVGLMRVGNEEREVGAGDAIFIPRGAPHELQNTGTEPMTIILVCGPAYFPADHRVETSDEGAGCLMS